MKTEEAGEYIIDFISKMFPKRISCKIAIIFTALVSMSLMGALVTYVLQGKTDYEISYREDGTLIGICMSYSVEMIPIVMWAIKEDWKDRFKNFSLFGLREITMIVMSLLTLDSWFCMAEENFTMIYGRKCPSYNFISTITMTFFTLSTFFEFLLWSNLASKMIQDIKIFLMFIIIPDNSSMCPQCSAKNSTSLNKVIKLESKAVLV